MRPMLFANVRVKCVYVGVYCFYVAELKQCSYKRMLSTAETLRRGIIKGTVSRDFLLLNQFPPSPRVFHLDRFEFFRKFAEIFASQGAPPVSTTPVANFSTIFASGGK